MILTKFKYSFAISEESIKKKLKYTEDWKIVLWRHTWGEKLKIFKVDTFLRKKKERERKANDVEFSMNIAKQELAYILLLGNSIFCSVINF